MPNESNPSVLAGSLLGLTLFYTTLVMSSMLLLCFDDLRFAHVMILQLPSVFVPILVLTSLFKNDVAALVSGGLVLFTAVYETAYGLWLISANSIVKVSMDETEELVGFSMLVGILAFRLMFLYIICVDLWNLFEVPLHERLATRKEDLKQAGDVYKKYGGTFYSAYITWLVSLTVVLELEMLLIAFAELHFINWHLPLVFLSGIPCIAALATFKNQDSIDGISTIIAASTVLLLGSFLWIIITSISHDQIGEWTVIVLLIVVAFHFVFSGFLAYSIRSIGKLGFNARARWWMKK
jgi:hypothetical protein